MHDYPKQRGGYAKMLLRRVEKRCKEEGLTKVQTVSKSGADFYVNQGYDIIGIRHGDYILEKEV